MTGPVPRRGGNTPRRSQPILTLRHLPAALDDEPAFRDDPILGWRHTPEPPADLRVGGSPWPPRRPAAPKERPPKR